MELNPALAYKKYAQWNFTSLILRWQENFHFIGFVDGSSKVNNNGPTLGIRSYLINKVGKVIYIFSGPIQECSGWLVELIAVSVKPSTKKESQALHAA